MSTITTHVLDTAIGRPAVGVAVALERLGANGALTLLGTGITDSDGRIRELLEPGTSLVPGEYRLRFATGEYFARAGRETFYPLVDVAFRITDEAHYHVPLLLNPYGYSTYRGS